MNWKPQISGVLGLGCYATEGEEVHEEDLHQLSIYHVLLVYIGTSIRSSR